MEPVYIDFAFVKEHANIRAVLSHYGVTLPSNGAKNIKIRCLFHQEAHPSLSINLERKVFHCFGCDAKGDLLAFVALKDGGDLREAAQLIAELSGIPCAPERAGSAKRPGQATRAPRKPAEAQRRTEVVQTTAKPQTSPPGPSGAPQEPVNAPLSLRLKLDPTHPYLKERGLAPETIATFGLGYAARGLMRGRIAIPIHNERGDLVAYAGRWPSEEGWPDGEEKYKLPEGFKKRHVLFNLHRTLNTQGKVPAEHLVLVEGYFGAMHLHALQIPVVALMGSSIAPEQLTLLQRSNVERVTLLLDGDSPGRASAAALLPLLASSFFVRDVVLPDGLQPDRLTEAEIRHRCDHMPESSTHEGRDSRCRSTTAQSTGTVKCGS